MINKKQKSQLIKISITFLLILIGLYIFKWYPMQLYGKDILFDASAHIAFAAFVLYTGYFFIDQNKNWRIPYFIFSFAVLTIIALQRIQANAHNDIGLLLGFIIATISIALPHWKSLKNKLRF